MSSARPSTREIYDTTAHRWVRHGPISLSDFTARQPVLALCEPVTGLRVLDLGAGEGYCSRHLRRAGASRVEGLELSAAMVDLARREEQREPLGIGYHHGDATDLSRFGDAETDLVLAMFLFNYLDPVQTGACMQQVARALRPGGRFVFAVPHPAFPFVRSPAPPFYLDAGSSGYFSSAGQWFPGRIWRRDGIALDVQLCHKTIEQYFTALREAGFRSMPRLLELGVTEQLVALDPAFFGPLRDTPLHMAMEVIR
jgi:SAM-dependent methyltransferase